MTDLRALHPSPPQIAMLCDVYFSRIDPIFKVLHRPTVKASILTAAHGQGRLASGGDQEALMFAMYLAAVTSMSQDECVNCLHMDRQSLLIRYRYGSEAALTNVDFLNSMELVTLQAFVIYLVRRAPSQAAIAQMSLPLLDPSMGTRQSRATRASHSIVRLTRAFRCVFAATMKAAWRGR